MCGICGFYKTDHSDAARPSQLTLERMTSALNHRGPDGQGIWLDSTGTIGLGQTRLAIIDLAGGQQPMKSTNGKYVIVFNGEIYNYRELRLELEKCGHHFATHSDTEVIMEAYSAWGYRALAHLHGMFAFALLDIESRRLCLARDQVGIKPLYYVAHSNGFYFGSEIKSILMNNPQPRVNYEALADFFIFGYPLLPKTAFKDVYELEPGSWLEIGPDGVTRGRYWTWERVERGCDEATALDETEAVLVESLKEHLVADVPIGAFLSGGIDSSLLVALLVKHLGVKVDTFNVKFGDIDYDESHYARLVAAQLGVQHHEIELKEGYSDLSLVETVLRQFDQPFGDSSAIPTYLISQQIQRRVKVVIGGDGGDEMFGGYTRFYYADVARRFGHLPRPLLSIAGPLSRPFKAFRPDQYRQSHRLLGAASQRDAQRLLRLSCANYPEQLPDILLPHTLANIGPYSPSLNPISGRYHDPDGHEFVDATVGLSCQVTTYEKST